MSLEQNKQLVLSFMETVWNQRHTAVISDYLSAGSLLAGSIAQWVGALAMSFPDYQITVKDVIAQGETVIVRSTMRGTNSGSFMRHPATGKSVEVERISIYKLKGGKIVSVICESHWLMIYKQLGIARVVERASDQD